MNPGFDPGDLAQAHQVVGHHDQLAGQPDQIVKLRGIDPYPGVQPRQGRRGRGGSGKRHLRRSRHA